MLLTFYMLAMANLAFLIALFFFFRHYIRRELTKVEYVRQLEQGLRELLLDVNRSAEDITQVIEDRSQQLQNLLLRHGEHLQQSQRSLEEGRRHNYNLEQRQLRLRELEQDTSGVLERWQSRILSLQEQLEQKKDKVSVELFNSISAKLENELLQLAKDKLMTLQQRITKEAEEKIKTAYASASLALEKFGRQYLKQLQEEGDRAKSVRSGEPNEQMSSEISGSSPTISNQQHAEIRRYIDLGLDPLIISQKTGVALNLVDILVSMRESGLENDGPSGTQ